MLEQEGAAHHPVAISGLMRESLAVEELEGGKQFRFILPGPELSRSDQERCLDQLTAAASGAQCIIASGSLPPAASVSSSIPPAQR